MEKLEELQKKIKELKLYKEYLLNIQLMNEMQSEEKKEKISNSKKHK